MERLVGCQKANECSWEPCPSCGVPYGHLHKENCSCLQPPAPSSTGATLSPFELPIGEFLVSHPSPDAGLVERLRAQIDYSPEDRGSAIFEEAAAALEVKDAEIAEWAKAGTRWSEKMSETQAEIEYWRSLYRNACKDRSEVQAEIENMRMVLDDTARDRNEAQAEVERLKAQLKPLDDLREMGVWDDES
jgi:hypothetical protein